MKHIQGTETCAVAYNTTLRIIMTWMTENLLQHYEVKYAVVSTVQEQSFQWATVIINMVSRVKKKHCHNTEGCLSLFCGFDHLLFGIYQDNLCGNYFPPVAPELHFGFKKKTKQKNS